MTNPKTPLTFRTVITGAAMLGSALVAFSLNQGGLTGRATGGATGCGGTEEPVAVEGERGLEASPWLNPTVEASEGAFELPLVRLSDDGAHVIRSYLPAFPSYADPDGPPAGDGPGALPREAEFVRAVDIPWGHSVVEPEPPTPPDSLWRGLGEVGLGAWQQVVERAGLRAVLEDPTAALTLLVPSEAALERFDDDLLRPENQAILQAVVMQHIVSGRHTFADLPAGEVQTQLVGQPLQRDGDALSPSAGPAAHVVRVDMDAASGMIHEVDRVLMPALTLPILLLKQGYAKFHAMLDVSGLIPVVSQPEQAVVVLAVADSVFEARGWEMDDIREAVPAELEPMMQNHVFKSFEPMVWSSGEVIEPRLVGRSLSGLDVLETSGGVVRFADTDHVSAVVELEAANGFIMKADGLLE